MPASDPDKFVNREKELSLVEDKVSRLVKGNPLAPHERVIHFVGPSGIGKSCLLEKIYAILNKEPMCIPVLISLEKIGSKREKLVGEFLVNVYQEFCRYQNLSVNTILKEPVGALSKYAAMVTRAINLSAANNVPVLLLDEISFLERKELQNIEEFLLAGLLQKNSRFMLITAGRLPAGLIEFSLYPSSANTFILSAFDEKITSVQLEKLKPGSKALANKVFSLGGGIPGNSRKLADLIVGAPLHIPNELQAIQSLLMDVKSDVDERFYPIIEAICILPVFMPDDTAPLLENHPAFAEQWNDTKVREAFTGLNQVRLGPGGLINWDRAKKSWVMDEPTRALFERELQMRDTELWRKLHCTAYQIFMQWGEEYDSQLYRDKAAYHQQRLQSAGFNCDDLEKENL